MKFKQNQKDTSLHAQENLTINNPDIRDKEVECVDVDECVDEVEPEPEPANHEDDPNETHEPAEAYEDPEVNEDNGVTEITEVTGGSEDEDEEETEKGINEDFENELNTKKTVSTEVSSGNIVQLFARLSIKHYFFFDNLNSFVV